jgi:2-keto-4-pentenoate hydratase/2-oxohepta-3-ene-1,7-dioic acid hydratase in catechol pathway
MRVANLDGRAVLLTGGGAVDIERASGRRFGADQAAVFDRWYDLLAWSRGVDPALATPFDETALRSPAPLPRQVFAVALNYPPHAAEAGYVPPAQPLVFTKFPSCLTGPFTSVPLPPGNVDWEVELVAVVGKPAHRVPAERGWEPIVAVTVGQDLSERLVQLAGSPAQFSLGKSFPGFGPIGPALVSLDELPDRDDLAISGTLNGEVMQADRTSNMIFPVPVLVAHLSAICPLYPGDLIFTGTPAGVGNRRTPPRFLTPADELVSTIEHVGTMRHRFRHATAGGSTMVEMAAA